MFVSYAQNFEDVMLWRALGQVENGFYIDIGAQDPIIDSVSLAFFERGWRGVHVEPMPVYAQALREARPDEVVVQVALGEREGVIQFCEIPGGGLSTGDPATASRHVAAGFTTARVDVPCMRLSALLDSYRERVVHWMKIDVEGMELSVLRGWAPSEVRPWVVILESTLPLSKELSHARWEPIVIGLGYQFAYFDGLNRYYVSLQKLELLSAFSSPPNVFDDFTLAGNGSHAFCTRLNAALAATRSERDQFKSELTNLESQLKVTEERAERSNLVPVLEGRIQELTVEADRRVSQAFAESVRLVETFTEREKVYTGQLQDFERRVTDQYQRRIETIEAQNVSLLDALAERERVHAVQLVERERSVSVAYTQRLQVSEERSAFLLETLAGRERTHADQMEALDRRFANAELQLAAASAAAESKEALQSELAQARVNVADAQEKITRHTQLLAEAQAEITKQRLALSLLGAEHARMNDALRATLDAYARQVQALQSEQGRLNGLLVMRLWERARRLSGRPTRATEAPQPFVEGMLSTGPFAGTDLASGLPELNPTAFKSERPVAHTPKTTITHVHQLMVLRGHAFVDSAYASLLNRRPDPGGLEYYLTRLRTDQDKAQILIELATSEEGRARNKSLVGLQDLISARNTRSQRLRRWLLRRPGQDQTLARIEANIGAMGDEFDVRLQAMDQRLSQLSRTLDGVVTLLSAKIEAISKSVEVASSLMVGDAEAVAKARLALFESQSLVAQTLQTGHPSAGSDGASANAGLSMVATVSPTTDALSCYLTAEAGSTSLIDSLSRHLATTTQAKTLSTN